MPEIRKIKRKDLDTDKYSRALNASLNYRIYAEHWYLDILTNQKWECLVYNDYEVIMPIPLQYKFRFKFVLQPLYCQQLGVFYSKEIDEDLFKRFEKLLHKYRVRAYHFNEENNVYTPEGKERVNYLLSLNKPYPDIFENFERDRKKDIRRNSKKGFKVIEKPEIEKFLELLKTDYSELVAKINLIKMRNLIEVLIEKESLFSYTLMNSDSKIISTCLLAKSNKRLILLFSVRNKKLESKGSFAFLMNYVIEQNSAKNLILDFEGSMIEGIANFNKSLGAEPNKFSSFSNFRK